MMNNIIYGYISDSTAKVYVCIYTQTYIYIYVYISIHRYVQSMACIPASTMHVHAAVHEFIQ